MGVEIVLPKLGFSMDEGVLVAWLVEEGGTVATGQPLFSLESEKSVQDIESPATGVLKIRRAAGETCKVGDVIGEIVAATAAPDPGPGAVVP